jgi:predicted nucleic acid-binding protein
MSADLSFVDTNVLVYAFDETAVEKHDRARLIVRELWESRTGCLSVQVLQEFLVTVTRKIPKPLDTGMAREIITDLSLWRVHAPGTADVLAAIDCHYDQQLSFWDALIVCSAASLGCGVLYSEDLNPGQRYQGVLVQNPLLA